MMRNASFAALMAGLLALPAQADIAKNGAWIDYKPGILTERLQAGETLVLNFKAVWSGTSLDQVAVVNQMKAEQPELVDNVTFIRVDWDTFGRAQVTERRQIPRHGTFVVLKGKDELDRLVAETSEDKLRALLDRALIASGG